jgi:MFS family permease
VFDRFLTSDTKANKRRRTAISGVILLAIGSLNCVFAKSSTVFIGIRVLQGI